MTRFRFRRTQEEAMDAYLDSVGLWRKPTAKDGSSLFRAVAEQLFQTQVYYDQVQQACLQYLAQHQEHFTAFIEGQDPKILAGQVEITALSRLYRRDFIIYQSVGKAPVNATQNGFVEKVVLCLTDGNHYDSVYPKTFGQSIAICQSIVYETLYRGVFKLNKELEEAVRFIREQSKSRRYRKESCTHWCPERADIGPEGDVMPSFPQHSPPLNRHHVHDENARPVEGKSSPPVPFRIAKALDPEIYRNVELDIWQEALKEQQQRDLELARDSPFAPGDKCQVMLNDGDEEKCYTAHIQEISNNDKGPVTLFIEELGQRLDVPFSRIKPLPNQLNTSPQSGWNYKKLSGFYKKPPLEATAIGSMDYLDIIKEITPKILQHDTFSSRKKNKRGKQGVTIILGQGQGFMSPPPADGIGRGRGWNGVRSPSPRYGGSGMMNKPRQLIDSAGHPIRQKWQQDKSEEGMVLGSPPPGDLPPEMTCQPIPDDNRVTNGMEQLSLNGQSEIERLPSPPPGPATCPSPSQQMVMPQTFSHPPPPPPCQPQMQLQPQQQPQQQPSAPQQVLMPFYPCIPISYSEVASGHVNMNYGPSQDPGGADLPLGDLPSLRFFYNLGQNYYRWYSYNANYNQMSAGGRMEHIGGMQHQQPAPLGYGNGCPTTTSTNLPCSSSNNTGIVYFTQQPTVAAYHPTSQPMQIQGYNYYPVPTPQQQPTAPGPPHPAHCFPQYAVYSPHPST